ncbi:unnamed protein product [Fraxinus pennsylvanica]|uniref:DNA-directed RNA polymerase n=1 Tax=Fraxinus pennsylvanica TaxID=56036 RepID=A0AAD1ZQ05_9LAMI|nr:unnamed protein product [Fraxinus pennsylvanica]
MKFEVSFSQLKYSLTACLDMLSGMFVYSKNVARSDKFKTGVEQFVENKVLNNYHSDIIFGQLPVMVKSDLCWLKGVEKGDCEFDHGGYFIINSAEKTFIAQEQTCLKRLWLSNDPLWTIAYRPVSKCKRVYMKLVPKVEQFMGGEKFMTVYFSVIEIPIWILFFALGTQNDREIVNLIGLGTEDCAIINVLLASIHDADKQCEGFRKGDKAVRHVEKLVKSCQFPPKESIEECISNYLFPNLKSFQQKARFLAYMVKCLLEVYTGHRKADNRDDFRNKRLELSGELLERELRVHIKHAERRMVRAMQRNLYGDRDVQSIEHYMDASIITNGLSRAFSTGAWSHPFKRMERISGVVATLRRTNPLQTIADMRKTRQQVSYTVRVGDSRYP